MSETSERFPRVLFWVAALTLLLLGASARAADPTYDLAVAFQPEKNRLTGAALIRLPQPRMLTVELGTLRPASIMVDGKPIPLPGKKTLRIRAARSVEIRYSGVFNDLLDNDIQPGSIILTDAWYPEIGGAARYRLRARMPKGYVAVSEADSFERLEDGANVAYRFDFPYPLTDGISLAASTQYAVAEARHGEVLLQTYLKTEFAPDATVYLDRMKALLADYEAKFGPYPYRRLALVEAPLTSALSQPTYLLLNPGALREVREGLATLAHELVHQWFGNLVYVDFKSGNWAEGAAIYFAEHYLDELKGDGWRFRKRILTSYHNRVRGRQEIPLTAFSMREDLLTRWIGYGKGAFVYHMLRQEIGDDAFFSAIHEFLLRHRHQVATWSDLRAIAERAGGRNLGWFFRQWVESTGTPNLQATAQVRRTPENRFETTVTLTQSGRPFRLRLPVTVKTAGNSDTRSVWLDSASATIRFEHSEPPVTVILDENYDVLRTLSLGERYPTLMQLEAATPVTVVRPMGDVAPYQPLIDRYRKEGRIIRLAFDRPEFPRGGQRRSPTTMSFDERSASRRGMRQSGQVSDADIGETSFFVLGRDNRILNRLLGATEARKFRQNDHPPGASIEVVKHPANAERFIAVLDSPSASQTAKLLDRVENLGGYSYVRIERGAVSEKRIAPHPQGWSISPAWDR